MTPERYERLCQLFDQAQQRPAGERAAFLDQACGDDPVMRAEVEKLLDHDRGARAEQLFQEPCPANANAFLSTGEPTIVTAAPSPGEPDDALIGRRIGPYLIQERIGRGGMGSVYRAQRQDAYRQQVALKVIRPGLDGEEILRRFRTERQVLAELQHPCIARLLDGGATDDGRPYFVMEYIDGEPLDHYCERQQLSTPGRLRLLQAVCAAVQHAHERQVIHRDLKPGNVLVTAEGLPRVTDFGLAKRLASNPGGSSSTPSGAILGTPSYMAPEQAAGKGKQIGAAADVYALGAILYELLTGRPPFRAETPLDTLLLVLSEEPVPPGRLHPKLARDLETICLKCLNKEPQKRYPSAAALADELGRFLRGEPIQARPVSPAERFWRWCRRNPVVAGLTASAAIFLLAGTGISTYFGIQANRRAEEAQTNFSAAQRNLTQAVQQRDRADHNLRLARDAVDKTVNKITENPRLKEADFHPLRRDLLGYLVPFYEEFVKQQENDAALRAERGLAWFSLAALRQEMGDREGARADYDQIAAIFGQLATEFPTEPEYRKQLARSRNNRAVLLHDGGKTNEAATAYRDALQIRAQLAADFPAVPPYRRELARSHINLGNLQYELGKLGEAEAAYRAARQILVQLATDFPTVAEYRQDLATSHNGLGVLLLSLDKGDQAETELRDALRIQAQLATDFPAVPEYRQDLAQGYNNLGVLLRKLGKPDAAEAAYRDALKIQARLADDFLTVPEYRKDLAQGYNNLGVLLRKLGKRDAAEAAYRDALKIQTRLTDEFPSVPEYRRDLATSYNNLGNLLDDLGKCREAEGAFRDAQKIQTQLVEKFPAVPDYQNELAVSLVNLARLVQGGNEPARARQLLEEAVPHHQAALKANDRNPAYRISFRTNRQVLAEALLGLGDHTAAADAADQLVQAAVDPAGDVYNAGCFLARCVPLAEGDSKLTPSARQEHAQAYANRAVAALRQAVQNGFQNVAHMKKDPDLNPLRSKPKFRQLLKELEAQSTPDGK
jgi:serine/threonine protein kinase